MQPEPELDFIVPEITPFPPTDDPYEKMWRAREHNRILQLPNLQLFLSEKWMGLKRFGYTEQECEELCRPKEVDREAMLKRVAALIREDKKVLRKINAENRRKRTEPGSHFAKNLNTKDTATILNQATPQL